MLKKISFHGFKSFADKVEVEFSQGITAVIGPNGCGKSNIFDGVRWVLGEQSAKSLRGGKMDDVIFSGSASRKPQDMAEVTLVLDNQTGIFKREEEEISVTRRATRGKGSEYFINGEAARMKDVHELFMDTGVGSNSYSIIGQGQIEKILSTKLEERRAIFEESSGIVKLKNQKEQTEKHLAEIETNVIRIEDILKEIEKQLKPLREQSAKAQSYNQLKEELYTVETQYLLHEYDAVQEKLEDANEQVTKLDENVSAYQTNLQHKEEEIEQNKTLLQEKNDELLTYQQQMSLKKEELGKLEGSITVSTERIQNAERQIIEINEQLHEIETKYSLSTEDFRTKQMDLATYEEKVQQIEQELQEVSNQLVSLDSQKIHLATEIEFARTRSIEEYNELTKEQAELTQLAKKEEESDLFLNNVSAKMDAAMNDKQQVEASYQAAKEQFESFSQTLESSQQLLQTKQAQLHEAERKQIELNRTLQDTENELIRKKNQAESLEQSIDNNESFFEGVKAVLQAKKNGRFSGVHGAIADLVHVKKTYEVAMESLLQSSMQFLVTEDDHVAKEAVTYLKNERLGRATFLPLNLATSSSFDQHDLHKITQTNGITPALEAVDFDQKFLPIVTSLLGRSLIAESLDVAVQFIKTHNIRAKIATLDGEIVQAGSISGGQSKKQKANYFKKRRELEEFQHDVVTLDEKITHVQADKSATDTIVATLRNDIRTVQSDVETYKEDAYNAQLVMEDAKRTMDFQIEKVQEIDLQEKEIRLSLGSLRKSVQTLRFSIEEKEKTYKELTSQLEEYSKKLEQTEQLLDETKEKKTQLTVEVNRLTNESKGIKSFLEDFSNDSESIEEKITRLHTRRENEEQIIAASSADQQVFETKKEELQAELAIDIDIFNAMKQEVKVLTEKIELIEQELKTIRVEKEVTEKELNTKKIYVSRKETEKNNILARLQETYAVIEEEIATMERRAIDTQASKKEIEQLKRKMNGLGNINHQAIEDCAALEERYSTEKEQFDDVKNAKRDLMTLLKSVEDEMTTRFLETFKAIQDHFKKIFVDLFGGGKASLTLVDPKDPLHSAIEIVAQPPGKKPQSINSLSGGEKAFTAVALIFSIISAKPSPFVIFDEVDAPLDDANVVRYAKYTKEYSKKCQFILVTHRKQCMTAADVLLGITQKVKGVSIMFPYAVEDLEKDEHVS